MSQALGSRLSRLALVLAGTAAIAVTSCYGGPQRVVVETRTVQQAALVPPPTGPQATGPLLESRQFGLEGGVSLSRADASAHRRSEGQPGHIVLDEMLRGRLAYGITDRAEVGLSAEYGSRDWAQAVASDVGPGQLDSQEMWRFGPHVRGVFAGDRRLGIGGLFEIGVSSLPYERVVYERVTETTFEARETTEIGRSLSHRVDSEGFWFVRAGLFGTASAFEAVSLTFGGLVQNHPSFFGQLRADQRCYYAEGAIAGDCQGVSDVDDIEPLESNMLLTVFSSVGVELGPFTLIGQVYGHATGPREIREVSPLGVDLAVRFAL